MSLKPPGTSGWNQPRRPRPSAPTEVKAGELGDGKPVTIGADDSAEEALRTMTEHKVRRLPVIDGHDLIGIVSQADIAKNLPDERTGDLVEASSERRFAVVAGASSGIGFELAKVFGHEGYDLLIAAEDDELDRAATELGAIAPSMEEVKVDLSRPEGVECLYAQISKAARPVDALALNAEIDLNVRSTMHLCKLVLADMVARDAGRILITSSFALAIRNELKDTEVTVTALMPGPTDTEFFERAGMEDTKVGAGEKAES